MPGHHLQKHARSRHEPCLWVFFSCAYHLLHVSTPLKRCISKLQLTHSLVVVAPKMFSFLPFIFDLLGEPHFPRAAYLVVHVSAIKWLGGTALTPPVPAGFPLFMRGLHLTPSLALSEYQPPLLAVSAPASLFWPKLLLVWLLLCNELTYLRQTSV